MIKNRIVMTMMMTYHIGVDQLPVAVLMLAVLRRVTKEKKLQKANLPKSQLL